MSDPNDERDWKEERYWKGFCPECGDSPCSEEQDFRVEFRYDFHGTIAEVRSAVHNTRVYLINDYGVLDPIDAEVTSIEDQHWNEVYQ